MAMIPFSVYGLLFIAEALILAVAVAGVSLFKWRSAQRRVDALRQALSESKARIKTEVIRHPEAPGAPQPGYADYLREQLDRSDLLLGKDPVQTTDGQEPIPPDESETLAQQMLAARHQFLQLELDVQALAADADAEARRQSVIAGMQALLAGLNRSAGDLQPRPEAVGPESAVRTTRSEESKLRDQIDHLRSVIDNQHGVMQELRHLLEEHGGDSEELHDALHKLGDVEAQAVELRRCLKTMGQENLRLRQASAAASDGRGPHGNPDAEMLRDLVGSQQRTISKLQSLLHTLTPDTDKAQELADAINKIQRSNNELNSCVMVLEDENNMLRGEVESLQERLAGLEKTAVPDRAHPVEPVSGSAPIRPDASGVEAISTGIPQQALKGGDSSTDSLLADLFGETNNERRDTEK